MRLEDARPETGRFTPEILKLCHCDECGRDLDTVRPVNTGNQQFFSPSCMFTYYDKWEKK